MPFITEELWHGMAFNADLPADQGGNSIMFAKWPKPLDADELAYFGILPEDEKTANDKYEAVNLGRGLKSTFNINKRVRFVLKPAQELPAHEIEVLPSSSMPSLSMSMPPSRPLKAPPAPSLR